MPVEFCICGNELGVNLFTDSVRGPCRCASPGPNRRQRKCLDLPEDICNEKQYNERKRYGLPLMAPSEFETRWV